MAAKPKQPTQMAINVSLNPGAAEFLERNANGGDQSLLLGQWATFWLDAQARGGIMLAPEEHDYIAGLNEGRRFQTGKQLAEAVAKGLKREDGQYTFPVAMDPAFIQPLTEYAESQGTTLDALVKDGTATLWANNWLYDVCPQQGRMIPMTADTLKKVADICDKANVDSTDVAAMMADGRFVPFSADDTAKIRQLAGKNTIDTRDYMALMRELQEYRDAAKAAA